ncbi:MAG: pantoate--beta-alanine ligase, partial [Rikenellaceae bacterium]
VVLIFVNPTQFNDKNDLSRYPRNEAKDCAMIEREGVDFAFVPTVEAIYPEVDNRVFTFGSIEATMEGASRPGHFNGVAQVVSRLFDIVKPEVSFFGQKDFQQVAVVKSMVAQLSLDDEIEVVPTVRERDGLALSSRNMLLCRECRDVAPSIYIALRRAQEVAGFLTPEMVSEQVKKDVEANGLLKVIYFEAVNAETMTKVVSWDECEQIQGCIAVQAGAVRLIDNIKLK